MWYGISEDVLVPSTLRPVQFHDIWSRSQAISPEQSLALAVLREALDDLMRYRFARRRRGQRLYWEAYDWIASDDREWPYSFVNLCEAAGIPVELTRQQVLTPASETAVELGKAA